jgi:hypothetical protein
MDSLRIAKVMAIQPGGYAVDLVFLHDDSQVPGVQVMSPSASTNSGFNDLAQPSPPPSGSKADVTQTNNRDIYALVGYVGRSPVVLGFLFPQVCQMLFADMNRRIDRHASDVYTSIDEQGNVELFHPSGTYLRIGTNPAHEDLTGKDLDGKWKIANNTGTAPHVHLTVANAGAAVASIDIDPSGNVTEQNNGNLSATVGGNLVAAVSGTGAVTVGGNLDITSPTTTIHGKLHVTQEVIANFGAPNQIGLLTHTHTQGADSHGDTEVPTNAPTAGT